MNFIKKNYSLVSLICSLLGGIIVYYLSFQSSKEHLIKQTSHTVEMATNVKWKLLDRKLYSLEQQLNLLSKNEIVHSLLSPPAGSNSIPKTIAPFDEYIKGILNNQGCSNMLLIRQSGELVYATSSNPGKTTIPSGVYHFAQQRSSTQNTVMNLKIILNENEPYQFYLCKAIIDGQGISLGALFMEVPREFLSIELQNTISLDSLHTYLVSSKGSLDKSGSMGRDTCAVCKWQNKGFILFSSEQKIKDTWTLLSVYPISQIKVQHIIYASALDGWIAFFVSTGIIMVIIYGVQEVKKAKGITHADIMLVQTTWNAVSEYSNKIIAGFYKYLFADAPEVKPMFKSAQAEQEKRMALMINTIVNSADSLEEFKGSIAQLAKKHTHMGVKREYFPIVVKAIICSVEDQYGKGFSPAHKKAWYKILNQVSAIMIEEMESYQRTLRNTPA